jgi:uncharacterized protein (TIGR02145 family)/uncharacterized repeat protein (TIGR02543 family)
LPIAPAKTGYIFGGWYTEIGGSGTVFTAITVVTASITVYAKWNSYTYTVTFDDQSATVPPNPTSKTVASPATTVVTLPTAPTKTGYTFGGWYTETGGSGTVFTAITVVTASITVFAKWTMNKYTLTLSQSVGCSTTTGGGLVSHGVATAINATSNVGYEFVIWNVTSGTGVTIGDVNSASTTVTLTNGDANVRANFQLKTYTLTTVGGAGGTATGGGQVTHGVAQAIIATANNGYGFVNWTTSSAGVTFANANSASTTVTLTSGAATIQANFIKTYTVTFNSQGGSDVALQTVNHGAYATVPTPPTKTSYSFDGWFKENTCTNAWFFANEAVVSNITLYAKWIVKDVDGNIYTTVTIGTQTWMVENLKTTKYRDSTPIPLVTDNTAWYATNAPRYCWYANDEATYKSTYGALYNWYVVNNSKLAPAGWHVPTNAEWDVLQNYLIANGYNWDGTTTGNKIAKAMAVQSKWQITIEVEGVPGNNLSTNNRSGFSALPGGIRKDVGTFKDIYVGGDWWSASESDVDWADRRYLDYQSIELYSDHIFKKFGFSVRLIRD